MTSRRPLYSNRELGGSGSPTRNVLSRSPRPDSYRENMNADEDENEFDESNNEPTNEEGVETDSNEDDSMDQSCGNPSIQHNQTHPQTAQAIRSRIAQGTGAQRPRETSLQRRPETKPLATAPLANLKMKSFSPSQLMKYSIIIILPLIAYSQYYKSEPQVKTCTFEKLKQRAPSQSTDVWKALRCNIEDMLNKKSKSPNVYLFLYTNESNESEMQKLVNDIALETSKCFNEKPLVKMSLKDFETQTGDDYGFPIEQYKKKIRDGNVFLIVDLNDIPPNAARALHTICDTYSPIAPDVVIFLTLRTHLTTNAGTPVQLAHHTLHELWKELPNNELDALITRVTDQVLLLQS
ncbi:uncharacterized protein LOC6583076 [Drosophila mojavensis]|uniref:Uncharacterized protein n=1 Tax=Drosophila mojavensis TaxID=7230 RepID=B4L0Y1_DROMO|nr:uncharacterized protein LOC6583076 [Drosophila mojavensis]EDW19231.2 uncharacterized protein Dmoj_GI13670 [Drosophila mojavensis]